jgi:hypothetical protein
MMGVEDLRHEHTEITLMLGILEKICELLDSGKEVDPEHLKQLHDFMVVFVDQCHHSKEEELLFPTLESINGGEAKKLIDVLIQEHEAGRKYAHAIGEAISDKQNMDLMDRSKIVKMEGIISSSWSNTLIKKTMFFSRWLKKSFQESRIRNYLKVLKSLKRKRLEWANMKNCMKCFIGWLVYI